MSSSDFFHLHTHSHFSLQDGIPGVKALVKMAVTNSMKALALTDHNSLAGAVPFLQTCKDYGIKPIIGCELTIGAFDYPPSATVPGQYFYTTLLVKNEQGYKNLSKLVTAAHKTKTSHPSVHFDTFLNHTKGLVVCIGSIKSELFSLLALEKIGEIEEYISKLLQEVHREDLYFEIQDHNEGIHRIVNERIIELADFLNIGIIPTNNVHYLHPEDDIAYKFLIHKDPSEIKIERRSDARNTLHFTTAEEMAKKFSYLEHPFEYHSEIAEKCNFIFDTKKKRFPLHDFTRGEDADSALWNLVFERSNALYGAISNNLKERLNVEFNYIKQEGFSNYFLLLNNICDFLKDEGIIKGVGRGKIVTSVISYILGITNIDPIEYHLRFQGIGSGKDLIPMTTIEIPSERLDDLLEFLQERYGESYICEAGKFKYWHRGVLFTRICEWAEVPKHKIASMLTTNILDRKSTTPIIFAESGTQSSTPISLKEPEVLTYILNVLHPRPSELIAAPGQIVISGENLTEIAPCEFETSDIGISQFETSILESLSLPRIHITSTSITDVLEKALFWIHKYDDVEFDLDAISLTDYETYKLLGEGLTNGIPPFNKISLKSLLRAYKPASIGQLIKILSMVEREKRFEADSPEDDITSKILECIVAYKCAYLKAHNPVSFMTALLTNSFRSKKSFTIILREALQMGIRILQPDINLSEHNFSREADAIRTGLAVIKGMGQNAFAEIEFARKGGAFVDLMDLCKRTDSKSVNYKLIANLIKAGALDSFESNRAQMLDSLINIINFSRKKDDKDAAKAISELTLFDIKKYTKNEEEAEPEIPDIDELPVDVLIKNEIAATGYCVTFDSLHQYKSLLREVKALSPYEILPKMEGGIVYVAGYIDHIEREGLYIEYGIEMVLDFDGKVVVVPQDVYKKCSRAIYGADPVLIGGRIYRREDEAYIKAHCIHTLKDIETRAQSVKKIVINMEGQDKKTLKGIYKLLYQYRGNTQVDIVNYEGRGKRYIKKIQSLGVFFSPPVYYGLLNLVPKNMFEILEDEQAIETKLVESKMI